jgi:hypothetical protein
MRIEVSRTMYEFAHGHKPRGFGRWLFEIVGSDDRGASTTIDGAYAAAGTFTAALRQAKERARGEARQIGRVRSVLVTVLS